MQYNLSKSLQILQMTTGFVFLSHLVLKKYTRAILTARSKANMVRIQTNL